METMLSYVNLVSNDLKIEENLEKIRQKRCDSHNKYKASHFCTNHLCIKNSTSFLCQFCYNNHSKNHKNNEEIQSVEDLFSTKRLTQMKEDCKLDSSHEDTINEILQVLDQIFGKLKETFSNVIDEQCKKAKAKIKQNFSIDYEYIIKAFKEHEQVLLDVFTKDEIINNYNITIIPYLETFNKVSETFRCQIEMVENYDKNIDLLMKNLPKINQKLNDIVDSVQQKISNFDELYNDIKLINPIQSGKSKEILLQKFKTIKIDKNIPRLHTDIITKIISYDNNTKYITCSFDKTIIVRNSEDNTVVRTLKVYQSYRDFHYLDIIV